MSPVPNNKELFVKFSESHYLGSFLARLPNWPPVWRASLFASLSYLVFLFLALLSERSLVIGSFIHIWQVSLSVTIFLGLWLGHIALQSIQPWLEHAGVIFDLSDPEFVHIVESTKGRLNSGYSSVMSLLLILPALTIAFFIGRKLPSQLFPFSATNPAFLYAVFLELSILMLHLLVATGFWLFFVFTAAARDLSNLNVDSQLVTSNSIRFLANTVLQLSVFLLVIIASAMPGVAYVVFSFKDNPLVLYLGITFGMAVPTLALTLSYCGPIYYLHRIMTKARDKRLEIIRTEMMRYKSPQDGSASGSPDQTADDQGTREYQRLLGLYLEARHSSVWPTDISSVMKLGGSSLLPVASFFAHRILELVFQSAGAK